MAKSELQKLKRAELLEMLVEQMERADRLENEVNKLQKQLNEREYMIKRAGELAKEISNFIKRLENAPVTITLNRNSRPSAGQQKKAAAQKDSQVRHQEKTIS